MLINGVEVPVVTNRRFTKHCKWSCPELDYIHEKLEKHPLPETVPWCKRFRVKLAFNYRNKRAFDVFRCAECIGTEFLSKRKVQVKPRVQRYVTK